MENLLFPDFPLRASIYSYFSYGKNLKQPKFEKPSDRKLTTSKFSPPSIKKFSEEPIFTLTLAMEKI